MSDDPAATGEQGEVQSPPEQAQQIQEPPAQPDQPSEPQAAGTVVARYGLMHQIGEFRHNLDTAPSVGSHVVVRSERGVELAVVISSVTDSPCARCISGEHLSEFLAACGPEYPFRRDGKILRLANPQDIIDQKHLNSSARDEAVFARQQIRDLGLQMKLVTVEHLLGGERIIFYFTAEARVDFRELVRRLATQYRTRIEMRQVGARDEARLVADYERCGRRCCCQEFLKDLKPVSMRMAKTQKATLDPSKISGRCGRLMCCLRYEDECYEDLRKKLPRKGIWVKTADVVGRVTDSQILTQLVRLTLVDNTQVIIANEEILEHDVEPPDPQAPPPRRTEPKVERQREPEPPVEQPISIEEVPAPTAEEHPDAEPALEQPSQEQTDQESRRRRRSRRRRSKSNGQPQQVAGRQDGPGQQANRGPDSGSRSSKRRRRRRKKKPGQ